MHQLSFTLDDSGVVLTRDWLTQECQLRLATPWVHQAIRLKLFLRFEPLRDYDYSPFLGVATTDQDEVELLEVAREEVEWEIPFLQTNETGQVGLALSFEAAVSLGERRVRPGANRVCQLTQIQVERNSQRRAPSRPRRSFERRSPAAHEGLEPIFVLGSYRSGTSVMTWALGQHPNLAPMAETHWFKSTLVGAAAAHAQASRPTLNAPDVYRLDRAEYLRWIGVGLGEMHTKIARDRAYASLFAKQGGKSGNVSTLQQQVRSAWNPKRRWVDGTPENSGLATLLNAAFPEAQFVVMLRRPRSVVASLTKFDRAGGRSRTQAEAVADWLRLTEDSMRLVEMYSNAKVLVVRYDELVQNPKEKMQELLRFLGEPYFAPCADAFGVRINSSGTTSADAEALSGEDIEAAEAIYQQLIDGTPASQIYWGPGPARDPERIIEGMVQQMARATE